MGQRTGKSAGALIGNYRQRNTAHDDLALWNNFRDFGLVNGSAGAMSAAAMGSSL